jgi:adenosylcobyric acid synthase
MKNATTLMVQGTTSDAGKSTVVTALCRIWHRRGYAVAPFKPQNMALNSAVATRTSTNRAGTTPSGDDDHDDHDGGGGDGEIGRAQAVQAAACGLVPHVDMNPVLLKPQSDCTSQIIVLGQVVGTLEAKRFNDPKKRETLLPIVLAAHARLIAQYDIVIVEGAGSPAEVNLREGDIANMGFAEAIDCPVVIVVDIDKGGAYAHLLGTYLCLSETEQTRVRGFVINKFRGDQSLLTDANEWLLARTGVPILAVIPYLPDLYLEAEDAVDFTQTLTSSSDHGVVVLNVVVIGYPHMSNHTDFDVLRLHPEINLTYARNPLAAAARRCDLIILPGSKSVMADLVWLRDHGWDVALDRHLRYGGKVLGICGGFQMLGLTINDPHGVESPVIAADGLPSLCCQGLAKLRIETVLQTDKVLRQVHGRCATSGVDVTGYEIHVGTSTGPDLEESPLLQRRVAAVVDLENATQVVAEGTKSGTIDDDGFGSRSYVDEGAQSVDGQVAGCYWHGLFDSPAYLSHIAAWAAATITGHGPSSSSAAAAATAAPITAPLDVQAFKEQQFDRLADAVEQAWPHEDQLRLLASCQDQEQ